MKKEITFGIAEERKGGMGENLWRKDGREGRTCIFP